MDVRELIQHEAERLSDDEVCAILDAILDCDDLPENSTFADSLLWIVRKAYIVGYGTAISTVDKASDF